MGVRYSQELADRAQAWLTQPLVEKRSAAGLLELATIWAAIHRQPLPECLRQCQYSERSQSVAAYLLEFSRLPTSPSAMSDTTPSTYQFAPQFANETLVHEDLAGPVTAANLTDEVAEFFIKQGRKDLFVKRGAAAQVDEPVEVTPANALVPEADLTAEQEAHDETRQKLVNQTTSYNAAYAQVTAKLAAAQADKASTQGALDSEKQAHATTKSQLNEVQQQLATAQATITKLSTPKVKKVPADATPMSSPVVADASASPTSSPTAGTDASADAATGTN